MDSTSKRIHLYPVLEKGLTGKSVAKLYFDEVFKLHGLPTTIRSDRDTRFTSLFWTTLWGLCGTKLSMTAAYHHNANPNNERVHKVIEEMLRIITQTPPEDWDQNFPTVEFAVKNAVTSTGYTPFELDTGMHPLDPRTVWLGDLVWQDKSSNSQELSLIHIPSPRDTRSSRMPSSA